MTEDARNQLADKIGPGWLALQEDGWAGGVIDRLLSDASLLMRAIDANRSLEEHDGVVWEQWRTNWTEVDDE